MKRPGSRIAEQIDRDLKVEQAYKRRHDAAECMKRECKACNKQKECFKGSEDNGKRTKFETKNDTKQRRS